jgi:3-oxoacyl-[acyl-carrier-protein] synthase II
MTRQVCITGIGVVTPMGVGRTAFTEALFCGKSGIGELAAFDTARFSSHLGAEIKDFSARDFISLKHLRRMDRLSQITVASARLALEDAGITITPQNRDRIGIIFGTAFGATDIKTQCARILFTEGPAMISPILAPNTVMNAPAGHASIELGFRGVNTTVNHHATSGETAIAYAAMEIQRGAADMMLAGGADILSEFFFEAMVRLRAVSPIDSGPEGARPFDLTRNGPVLGEGCGIICLESLASAHARGVEPYAEVTGWGMSASAAGPTNWPEDPGGVILAMQRALQSAQLTPGDIDMIQAAANGGRNPDGIEAAACLQVFGGGDEGPLVTSLKGALGESFSSGGIRAAALALSLADDQVPTTLGLTEPVLPLHFVTGESIKANLRHGLLNGISFGGTYATVVISKT